MVTRELLKKFQQGCCTPDELDQLRLLLQNDKSPELEKLLEEDWLDVDPDEPVPTGARESVWLLLEASIRREESQKQDAIRIKRSEPGSEKLIWWHRAAASVIFLILAGTGYFFWNIQNRFLGGNKLVERVNEGDKALTINLSDGSMVTLYPGSKLLYPQTFKGNSRDISLDGKAFFSVVKDATRPFYVRTTKLSVRVLGTSFTVKAYDEREVAEVSVQSGKVTVSRPGEKSDIILLPNERISVSGKERNLVKKLAESPVVVDQKTSENEFEFSASPVSGVFDMLKKAYKVNIVYDETAVKNCTLTARLCDQPLFTKLEMICASIGASYEVKDTSIYITVREGCEEQEE